MNLRKKAGRRPLTMREGGVGNTNRKGRVTSVTYDPLSRASFLGYNTVVNRGMCYSCKAASA